MTLAEDDKLHNDDAINPSWLKQSSDKQESKQSSQQQSTDWHDVLESNTEFFSSHDYNDTWSARLERLVHTIYITVSRATTILDGLVAILMLCYVICLKMNKKDNDDKSGNFQRTWLCIFILTIILTVITLLRCTAGIIINKNSQSATAASPVVTIAHWVRQVTSWLLFIVLSVSGLAVLRYKSTWRKSMQTYDDNSTAVYWPAKVKYLGNHYHLVYVTVLCVGASIALVQALICTYKRKLYLLDVVNDDNIHSNYHSSRPWWWSSSSTELTQTLLPTQNNNSWWPLRRNNTDNDDNVDLESVQEEWSRQSEQDPYWWSREE